MFSRSEKELRWSVFELLPISSQKHIHNLIMTQAERYAVAPIRAPVQRTHLVRVK